MQPEQNNGPHFEYANFDPLLEHMRETELKYHTEPKLMELSATLLGFHVPETGKIDLVFDRSIFYPKGGGQPADLGTIHIRGETHNVLNVTLSPKGQVIHTCSWPEGTLPHEGESALLTVDNERRLLHARSHTAGHLIDLALQLSEFPLSPIKANHAPGESWVKFDAKERQLSAQELTSLGNQIESFINRICERGALITAKKLDPVEATVRGIEAPPGKSPRVVTIEGYDDYARGCGGTHVESTNQIGDITISRVGLKKSVLTITYQIETTDR